MTFAKTLQGQRWNGLDNSLIAQITRLPSVHYRTVTVATITKGIPGMIETHVPSKLLALLDAASSPETPASETFDDLSAELQTRLRQYALSTLDDSAPEDDTAEMEEQLVQLISQEPRGLLMLRSLLKDVAAVEELGPVPDELIERQKNRQLKFTPPKPTDFTVSLSKGRLRYTGSVPTRMTQSLELARDPNEGTTLLQHTQRLNHCEIKVAIETGTRQTFSIVLDFTYIDPQFANQPLDVSVADDGAMVQQSQPVTNKSVEFENLPGGSYMVQITAAKIVIDEFRAELRLDDQP